MSKHLSATCQVNIIEGGKLQLSKRKTRKIVNTGQNPYYYYNVVLKGNVWRKVWENHKQIEGTALQIIDKRITSPQIIPLADEWVVYLSVFNEILYYGIHLYDSNCREIIPGNGMNLTGDEVSNLFDFLGENTGYVGHKLTITIPQFTWEWHNIDGEIMDTDRWWTSELFCLQAALLKQPGDGWKLSIKTKTTQQTFNSNFLDGILLHLTKQRIKSLSNAVSYYNTQPDGDLSAGEIEMYGIEAANSISKMDILELTLKTVKKYQYVSMEASAYMMEKIAEYQKNSQIISQLKSDRQNDNFVVMLCE